MVHAAVKSYNVKGISERIDEKASFPLIPPGIFNMESAENFSRPMTTGPGSLFQELDSLWKCLPDADVRKLETVLDVLPKLDVKTAGDLAATLHQAERSLPLIAAAIRVYPSLASHSNLGRQERDDKTLIEALANCDDTRLEFMIPTSAVLGRAFVLAKINFLKAVEHVCREAGEVATAASRAASELVGDAVISKLAEELLSAALSNLSNPVAIKRAAAQRILTMWNNRLKLPVGEFPTVLLSAWRARRKFRAIFGTLIGASEVFSLIQGECESPFVSYFARDRVTEDEQQAFQEFIFGLSYEELRDVRDHMRENGLSVVSPEQVRAIIKPAGRPPFFGYPTADQMYASYLRRKTRAEYRAVSNSRGPRKTAEGYIMEAILLEDVNGDNGK